MYVIFAIAENPQTERDIKTVDDKLSLFLEGLGAVKRTTKLKDSAGKFCTRIHLEVTQLNLRDYDCKTPWGLGILI